MHCGFNSSKEGVVKLLQEGNLSQTVAKYVVFFQSAVSKTWTKYKQNENVIKGKHTG